MEKSVIFDFVLTIRGQKTIFILILTYRVFRPNRIEMTLNVYTLVDIMLIIRAFNLNPTKLTKSWNDTVHIVFASLIVLGFMDLGGHIFGAMIGFVGLKEVDYYGFYGDFLCHVYDRIGASYMDFKYLHVIPLVYI
jgi:hypothetical protein